MQRDDLATDLLELYRSTFAAAVKSLSKAAYSKKITHSESKRHYPYQCDQLKHKRLQNNKSFNHVKQGIHINKKRCCNDCEE